MKAADMLALCCAAKLELELRQSYVSVDFDRKRTIADSGFRDNDSGLSAYIGVKEFVTEPDKNFPDGQAMVPLVAMFHEVCGHGSQRVLQFQEQDALSRTIAANYYACRGSFRYYGISHDGHPSEAYLKQPYEIAAQHAAIAETKAFLDKRVPEDSERLVLEYVRHRQDLSCEFLYSQDKIYSSVGDVLHDMDSYFKKCVHAQRAYMPDIADGDAVSQYFKLEAFYKYAGYISNCRDGYLQDRMMATAYKNSMATFSEYGAMGVMPAVQALRLDDGSAFLDKPGIFVKDPPLSQLNLSDMKTFPLFEIGADGSIPYNTAFQFLDDLVQDKILDQYGNSVRYAEFDPTKDSGVVKAYGPGDYSVHIGVQRLGGPGDQVSAPDLAWTARQAMHEARHVYQKEVIFRNPMSGRDLDMAVMSACAMAYSGYNDETYGHQLAEIDADLHGTKDAIEALSGAFPDINWNMAMLEAYNSRNAECDAARADPDAFPGAGPVMTRAYIPGHTFNSMDEVYARIEDLAGKYVTAVHEEPCREFCEHDEDILDRNGWDGKFLDLLWGNGTKSGPARDREILASVLQGRVFDVQAYFPGMAGELEKIRSEHKVDGDTVRKLNRASYEASRGHNDAGLKGPEF